VGVGVRRPARGPRGGEIDCPAGSSRGWAARDHLAGPGAGSPGGWALLRPYGYDPLQRFTAGSGGDAFTPLRAGPRLAAGGVRRGEGRAGVGYMGGEGGCAESKVLITRWSGRESSRGRRCAVCGTARACWLPARPGGPEHRCQAGGRVEPGRDGHLLSGADGGRCGACSRNGWRLSSCRGCGPS
jgi:hypothetical protein